MPISIFDDLRKLHQERNKRVTEWRQDMLKAAEELKEKVAVRIGAPSTWRNLKTGEDHPYVEVISLRKKQRPVNLLDLFEELSDQGELPFGISIALDISENSYPKTLFNLPVAVRFSKGIMQLNLWNTDDQCVRDDASWSADSDEFTESLVTELEKFFEYDPYQGGSESTSIGFIQN